MDKIMTSDTTVTKGIVVTFTDFIHNAILHYEVEGFHHDHPLSPADARRGKTALIMAFDAATRIDTGWRMVVTHEALDYILASTGFCENTIDIFDCQNDHDAVTRLYNFRSRMKALRLNNNLRVALTKPL